MTKLAIFKIEEGNFQEGFKVTVSINEGGELSHRTRTIIGKLPPNRYERYVQYDDEKDNPQGIPESYQRWQADYSHLQNAFCSRARGKSRTVSSQQLLEKSQQSAAHFRNAFKTWLSSEDKALKKFRKALCKEFGDKQTENQIIIQTENALLKKLPWHEWDLFADIYTKTEVALCTPTFEKPNLVQSTKKTAVVRILAIFGNSKGIDVESDSKSLEKLRQKDAEPIFLSEPKRADISDILWEQNWDIFFFAGHSSSQDENGKIFINRTESLTIEQLKYGLRKAIEHGLKLAIFNSCDGLKLADDLADLNMPQVIVMREPVPDQVAQLFLKWFLELYSQGQSSYLAVRHARERLYENGLDDKYPGACWLPVIYQNPTVKPLSWNDLKFPENPYLGLNAFGEQEAARFFGRERLTNHLWQSFYDLHYANEENLPRLLPILGPSGSGKSSIALAGLMPALKQRDQGELGKLLFILIKPEKSPLETLAKALIKTATMEYRYPHQFIGKMQNRDGLQQIGADLYENNKQHLVIFIDQFEEIYTYRGISHEERNLFIENLMGAVSDKAAHLSVILTLRSDFLGETQHHPDLNQAIAQQAVIVPIMNEVDLRLAISEPAKQANLPLNDATVALLIAQSRDREGVLPLLQFALKEIWEGMREGITPAETLNKVGGVGGALAQKAQAIYNKLSDTDKSIARRAFLKLVQLGEGSRDTRCRVPVTNMVAKGEVYEQVSAVLHRFSGTDARLITLSDTNTLAVAEVTHEALLENWSDLREWLESSREDLRFAQRLDGSAKRWAAVKSEQSEKRAAGLLWQSLNLERLEVFYERNQLDMTKEQVAFFESSTQKVRQVKQIRHATIAGLIILTVVSIIGFLSAILAEKKAVQVEQIRTENLFESQLKHASLLARWGVEDYTAARAILQQTYHLDNEIALSRRHARDWLAGFVDLMGGTANKVYEGAGAALKSAAVSPDGKLLAAAGEKSTLVLFDVASGKLIKRLEGHDLEADGREVYIRDIAFHPQGEWLASAGDDKRIIFWSLSGEKQWEWQAPNRVFALAVSPDGRRLAASTGADDKTALGNKTTLWDVKTGEVLRTFEGHNKIVFESGLNFNPTGELLATASYDHTARLWDVTTGKTIRILRGHTDEVTSVSFSPNGQLIATSSVDNKIMLWEVDSAKPPRILTGHQDVIYDLRFVIKEDRLLLLSGSLDRTLRIWDIDSGVTIRVLQGHEAGIGEGGIAIHEGFIFSASWDQTVRRWTLDLPHQQMVDLPCEPASTAIAPDGNSVAVGFNDGALRWYSLPDTRLLWEREQVHASIVKRLAFNAEGTLLASASSDNTVKLWQIKEGQLQEQQTFAVHSGVHAVAFSPDSQIIATAGDDGQIGLFTVGTSLKRFINAHKGKVASVSFDNSGRRLLSSGMVDFTLRLWNLKPDPPTLLEKEFPIIQHKLMWASLSPDNKRIVRVGRGSSVAIYATEEAQEQYRLVGHQQTVLRAIFSPDSQQVATISGDATVRLWDLNNGNELFVLHLPANTGKPYQIWDFDFRCHSKNCWIAVPLTQGKLVLYEFGAINEK